MAVADKQKIKKKWTRRGSNSRHSADKTEALPTELHVLVINIIFIFPYIDSILVCTSFHVTGDASYLRVITVVKSDPGQLKRIPGHMGSGQPNA